MAAPIMSPDVARWLRDEILTTVTYTGPAVELRPLLDRHAEAVRQLTDFVDFEIAQAVNDAISTGPEGTVTDSHGHDSPPTPTDRLHPSG